MDTRTERDPLGEHAVPAGAYYGIQTARAVENFPISGLRAHPGLGPAAGPINEAARRRAHNMTAHEVLANRAAERLGEARGTYTRVHPNDHVNMGQSTNDVFPTGTRLALLVGAGPAVRSARSPA